MKRAASALWYPSALMSLSSTVFSRVNFELVDHTDHTTSPSPTETRTLYLGKLFTPATKHALTDRLMPDRHKSTGPSLRLALPAGTGMMAACRCLLHVLTPKVPSVRTGAHHCRCLRRPVRARSSTRRSTRQLRRHASSRRPYCTVPLLVCTSELRCGTPVQDDGVLLLQGAC